MKRATELFTFDQVEAAASPFVGTMWQTRSGPASDDVFMSVAGTQWEIVVARPAATGATWLTVRGPDTRATPAPVPGDTEFFGIQFGLGTFMPSLDMKRMADRSFDAPVLSDTSFWLAGQQWEIPGAHNADVFVDRLERAGLLVHDPVVEAALQHDLETHVLALDAAGTDLQPAPAVGRNSDPRARAGTGAGASAGHGRRPATTRPGVLEHYSRRTVERRVAQATGLTRGTIRQIRRVERAVELLSSGVPVGDVVERLGYSDQSHLSRSLRRFVGQTPARVAAGA
jgi:hypothetical protein